MQDKCVLRVCVKVLERKAAGPVAGSNTRHAKRATKRATPTAPFTSGVGMTRSPMNTWSWPSGHTKKASTFSPGTNVL